MSPEAEASGVVRVYLRRFWGIERTPGVNRARREFSQIDDTSPPLPSGCVVIDKDLLLNTVRTLNAAGKLARADTVSVELGASGDDGSYWDVITVADDLAELESLGKIERPDAFAWEGIGPPPKTRIAYVVTGE